MQTSDLMDIYDGVFIEGSLYIGAIYDNKKDSFVFGQFNQQNLIKLFSKGSNFPFHLVGLYKHRLYPINLSYYYKFTPLEVVLLSEPQRILLYRAFAKGIQVYEGVKAGYLQRDYCKKDDFFQFFEPKSPLKKPESPLKMTECPLKNTESPVKMIESLLKDPLKKIESPCKIKEISLRSKESPKFPLKKSSPLIKREELRLKEVFNQKDLVLQRNKSLEGLNVLIDDSPYKNKSQAILNKFFDREFIVSNDESEGIGLIHDFTKEICEKNHKN